MGIARVLYIIHMDPLYIIPPVAKQRPPPLYLGSRTEQHVCTFVQQTTHYTEADARRGSGHHCVAALQATAARGGGSPRHVCRARKIGGGGRRSNRPYSS